MISSMNSVTTFELVSNRYVFWIGCPPDGCRVVSKCREFSLSETAREDAITGGRRSQKIRLMNSYPRATNHGMEERYHHQPAEREGGARVFTTDLRRSSVNDFL